MTMLTPAQIRQLRKAMGLTTTQFATLLGISHNTVARWEFGDRHPRWAMMVRLNDLLKIEQAKGLVLAAEPEPAAESA